MTPDQTIAGVEPGGLKFRNVVEVSPTTTAPCLNGLIKDAPAAGQQKSILAVRVSPGRAVARGTAAKRTTEY